MSIQTEMLRRQISEHMKTDDAVVIVEGIVGHIETRGDTTYTAAFALHNSDRIEEIILNRAARVELFHGVGLQVVGTRLSKGVVLAKSVIIPESKMAVDLYRQSVVGFVFLSTMILYILHRLGVPPFAHVFTQVGIEVAVAVSMVLAMYWTLFREPAWIVCPSESWQRLERVLFEWELTRLLNEVTEEASTPREGRTD